MLKALTLLHRLGTRTAEHFKVGSGGMTSDVLVDGERVAETCFDDGVGGEGGESRKDGNEERLSQHGVGRFGVEVRE